MLYKLFHLPFDFLIRPHGKGRPRFWKNRTLTPKADREFEKQLRQLAIDQLEASKVQETHPEYFDFGNKDLEIVHIYVGIEFSYIRGKKRPGFKGTRPDLDNLIKAFLDSMNGVLWPDDALVTSCNAMKLWGDHDQIKGGITIGYRKKPAKKEAS